MVDESIVTKTYLSDQFKNYSQVLKEKFVMKDEAGDLSGNDLLDEDVTFTEECFGIDANTTFPMGTPLEEIIKKMANKMVLPTVRLTSSLSTLVYEIGTTVYNGTTLTANVTKGSSDITKVEFFKNNTSVSVITSGVASGGNFQYADGNNITADTTYKVVVTNVEGKTVTSTLSVKFYNPFYYGVTSKTLADVTATDITSLTKDVSAKGTKKYKYTSSNNRIVIAYDRSYGLLSSILDQNSFENLSAFEYKEVTINSKVYYVYVTTNGCYCTDFEYTFKF